MEQRTNIVPTCSPKTEKHSHLVRQKNRYVGKNKWKNIKADTMARQKLLFSLKVTGNFWNYLLCWKTWDLLNYLLYKVVSRLALSYFLGILGGKLGSPTVSSWLSWSTGGLLQLTDFPSTLSVTMPSIKKSDVLPWGHCRTIKDPVSCYHLPEGLMAFICSPNTSCYKRQHPHKQWGPKGVLGLSSLWCSVSKVNHTQHPWNSMEILLW